MTAPVREGGRGEVEGEGVLTTGSGLLMVFTSIVDGWGRWKRQQPQSSGRPGDDDLSNRAGKMRGTRVQGVAMRWLRLMSDLMKVADDDADGVLVTFGET